MSSVAKKFQLGSANPRLASTRHGNFKKILNVSCKNEDKTNAYNKIHLLCELRTLHKHWIAASNKSPNTIYLKKEKKIGSEIVFIFIVSGSFADPIVTADLKSFRQYLKSK